MGKEQSRRDAEKFIYECIAWAASDMGKREAVGSSSKQEECRRGDAERRRSERIAKRAK